MDSEYPVFIGELEVRVAGGNRSLSASFPYNRVATRSSTGRTRKEKFSPGSLSWQVKEFEKLQGELSQVMARSVDRAFTEAQKRAAVEALEDGIERRNTHLLIGHDFDRPIADMRSGTLAVEHTDEAVLLRATLPPEGQAPSWVEDAIKSVQGGQTRGISPGFNPIKEGLEREDPAFGTSMVRRIDDAVGYEYSLVSRPSYSGTTVDVRASEMGLASDRRRVWL